MQEEVKDKCVYFHINPLKNEIFYVGMGDIKRPYVKSHRSTFWKNEVNKYGYIVDIYETGLTFDEACERELGFGNPNITACCKNRRSKAYGFIWKYKNLKNI